MIKTFFSLNVDHCRNNIVIIPFSLDSHSWYLQNTGLKRLKKRKTLNKTLQTGLMSVALLVPVKIVDGSELFI